MGTDDGLLRPRGLRRLRILALLAFVAGAALTLSSFASAPARGRAIILRNAAGAEAHVLPTGAIIQRLLVPDRSGKLDDVVLGYDTEAEYAASPYFGAVVGRVANRIANATFMLGGREYRLAKNEAGMPGSLHGGQRGFDKVEWRPTQLNASAVVLRYFSADGEEGYPGNVHAEVYYELTPASELVFELRATSDQPTPINLAQHSYFNLAVC